LVFKPFLFRNISDDENSIARFTSDRITKQAGFRLDLDLCAVFAQNAHSRRNVVGFARVQTRNGGGNDVMIFRGHEVFGGKANHFLGCPAEELQRGGRDISLQQIRANAQYHIHAVVHQQPKVGLIFLAHRLSRRTNAEHFPKKADHVRCPRRVDMMKVVYLQLLNGFCAKLVQLFPAWFTDAILQAFDLLELDGEDLRPLPLSQRKPRLARLLARARAGIALNEHTDEDGAGAFRHACKLGLEGIVSKRLTALYRSGPSRDWIKVKNPDSLASGGAMVAVRDCLMGVRARGWTLPKMPCGRLPMPTRACLTRVRSATSHQ
jgi:ATP dependent DNA ligase domain